MIRLLTLCLLLTFSVIVRAQSSLPDSANAPLTATDAVLMRWYDSVQILPATARLQACKARLLADTGLYAPVHGCRMFLNGLATTSDKIVTSGLPVWNFASVKILHGGYTAEQCRKLLLAIDKVGDWQITFSLPHNEMTAAIYGVAGAEGGVITFMPTRQKSQRSLRKIFAK